MELNPDADELLRFVRQNPGKSDAEIYREFNRRYTSHAAVNSTCRMLERRGYVTRRKDQPGPIRNYPANSLLTMEDPAPTKRNDIVQRVSRFIDESNAPCHRYLSWDYCYRFMSQRELIRSDPAVADHAALHLGWFLASWGMLRGSSGLLQKNYKVFFPVVEATMRPEFDFLVGFDPASPSTDKFLETMFEPGGLEFRVRKAFCKNDYSISPSATLITKTLLGVLGCSMAYDLYVTSALRTCEIHPQFDRRSISGAIDFYNTHLDQFRAAQERCPTYPPFKLLDMYFFTLGRD